MVDKIKNIIIENFEEVSKGDYTYVKRMAKIIGLGNVDDDYIKEVYDQYFGKFLNQENPDEMTILIACLPKVMVGDYETAVRLASKNNIHTTPYRLKALYCKYILGHNNDDSEILLKEDNCEKSNETTRIQTHELRAKNKRRTKTGNRKSKKII